MQRSFSRFGGTSWFTILAVAFAALAGLLVFAALQSDRTEAEVVERTAVVVASQEISPRTEITSRMVRIQEVPVEAAIAQGFRSPEQVIGLIARYPIAENEQIGEQKVGIATSDNGKEQDGLSFVVPKGMRAVGVSVSESSAVGGLIIAGDRVDVIAIWDEDLAGREKAQTLLQDVEVLSVAQQAQEPIPAAVSAQTATEDSNPTSDSRGVRPSDAEPQPKARTVTLAVSPADAQTLALAEQHTVLWLTLRAFEDTEEIPLQPTDLVALGALPPSLR